MGVKLFFYWIFRAFKPKLKIEFFESMSDMMLHNWEQLAITGNPNWMLKHSWLMGLKLQDEVYEENYFRLHDDYAKHSGDNEVMEKWATLVQKLLDARVKVAHGDKAMMNRVNLYEEMIKNLMKGSDEVDVIGNRMIIQQAYGQPIDPKSTSVLEYIKIKNLVTKQAEMKSAKNKGNGTDRDQ